MSAHRPTSAWKFATSSGLGNCACAPFFLDCALMNARAALANLMRAERDDPAVFDEITRVRLESIIDRLERKTMKPVGEVA